MNDLANNAGQQAAPRVFVTVPRFVPGIPITFGTLTNQTGPGGPLISAYPNYTWNANQGNNCDGLTSVFRVAVSANCIVALIWLFSLKLV